MKESDQVNLSRYLDGDLSPLERKGVDALLESDPSARRMAAEYALLRQYVKEMPREPLNVDMVPVIRDRMERKRRLLNFPTKVPSIAGILAASVLVATFSLTGYLISESDPARSITAESRAPASASATKLGNVLTDQAAIAPAGPPPASPASASEPVKAKRPEDAESAEAATQIAMAPMRSEMALKKNDFAGDTPKPVAPAARAVANFSRNSTDPANERFFEFLRATGQIDRRHALRLHVASASERQIASILSIIGQYHDPRTAVLESKSPVTDAPTNKADKDGDASGSPNRPPSLAYVALIPTGMMAEFQEALQNLPGVELEIDLPGSREYPHAENSRGFRMVARESLERADSIAEKNRPATLEEKPSGIKLAENPDVVPDAISQPLRPQAEATTSGTLDEVHVLIRTDPLRTEPNTPRPPRTNPVKK